ncbi:MAG: GMC oxidoreductase [Planctomycetota bacterium]|jgi:choline dehydrogenase-like flavoprotein
MIHDLGTWSGDALPDYDVAIVGSGPAGMTVAHELAGSGLRVCVLESGGLRPTRHGDALRVVRSEGVQIKDYSRERVLGGSSTTWAGLSSPLDAIDMEARALFGVPGWPIGRDELSTYWARATRYRFAPLDMYEADGFGLVRGKGDIEPVWHGLEEKVFLAAGEPQDFGAEWRHVFEREDTDLFLDATVLRLERGPSEGGVARCVVCNREGVQRSVGARLFVLGAGGIENARLLLASTDRCPAGLGNEHDQVGRYLMNHPKNYYGILHLAEPVRELPYLFGCLYKGYAGYAGLRLPDARLREEGLLNAYVRFEPLFPWSDNRGVESLVLLVKRSRGLFRRWKVARRDKLVTLRDYSETGDDSDFQNERKTFLERIGLVLLVLIHLPSVLRYAVSRLRDGRAPLVKTVRLRNFMEMEPHPDNRVLLGEERDPYGQPVPVVRHSPTPLDRRSLVALHAALAEEVQRNGLGRLESSLADEARWPVNLDASHHMGTTRMGREPSTSVVDPDCRLHGAENVYVAGASVFPTSGCANPTFTLVALAVRLAEHLRARLGAPPPPAAAPAPAARPKATLPLPEPAPGTRRVVVVGGGGRVRTDVLPALLSLPAMYGVAGVFARSAHPVEAGRHVVDSRPLKSLRAEDLEGIDLIHLAVSKGSVPAALNRLLAHDVSGIDLLIDTPVLLLKHMHHVKRLSAFRKVWVAEDCATLPWLPLVQRAVEQGLIGTPTDLVLDRSAYRYHGYALAKTMLACPGIVSARRTRNAGGGTTHEIRLTNRTIVRLVGPRDYASGRWRLSGTEGSITDARDDDGIDLPASGPRPRLHLEMCVERDACTGFRLGELTEALDESERRLLGHVQPGESVTARMDDLKRVGLVRMLRAMHAGGGGYGLLDGLDDMLVDSVCERVGRYRATPLTSVHSSAARGVYAAVTGIVSRD